METGDTVVLLHGLAAGRLNMHPIARALRAGGYRQMIAFLRHGRFNR